MLLLQIMFIASTIALEIIEAIEQSGKRRVFMAQIKLESYPLFNKQNLEFKNAQSFK